MTPNEFKQWRLDLGLTQSQAASKLGFKNRSSICLLENGKRPITKLLQLACFYISDVMEDNYGICCPYCYARF